jgi:replication factor C subunit 1
LKVKFKHPGKNGLNTTKALLITGPPGVGKTTSAHLCAKLEGYAVIELNASNIRSKKLLESAINTNNTSLDGWMHGGGVCNTLSLQVNS